VPPTPFERRRNDLAAILVVLIAFACGFGIRNLALNASKTIVLGDDLPSLRYPAGWITGQPEFLRFQAVNPASASMFDAQIDVFVRDLKAEETLDMARASWGLQRGQELVQYRELAADPVTVLKNQPALLTRYAYVADPARESGGNGLPVVVEGQDLLFFHGDQLIVITLAAAVHDWQAEQRHFQIVFDSLEVQEAVPVATTPTEGG
jgi:hypothetical protein